MDLSLIDTFVQIVEVGNLAEAGRRRGVTRSQVSRQLRTLESQVGAQLLRRTTRRLELTEAGRSLHQHGLRIQQEAAAAQAEIDSLGTTLRGYVRLSVPTGLGDGPLTPLLLAFTEAHPGISLRVFFANRVPDLIAAQIDVSVTITAQLQPQLVARDICAIDWRLFASPAYLARTQAPCSPADLARHRFLWLPSPTPQFSLTLERVDRHETVDVAAHLQSEHLPFLLRAARAGHGIALLPAYLSWQDVRDGRLQRVLPDWNPHGPGHRLYIVTTPNRRPSMAAQALIEFLKVQIPAMDVLAGDAPAALAQLAPATTDTPCDPSPSVVSAPGASGRARSDDTTNTGPIAVSKPYS
jgi:DNA-binding transcriptional LysR family regulator